jgi:hypothetical protein
MSAINPIPSNELYRLNGARMCPVPIDVCIDGYRAILTLFLGLRRLRGTVALESDFDGSARIDVNTNQERER